MIEQVFPLHCLAIAGLVAFAATRGLRSFPFKLTAMYAAFFASSEFIYQLGATVELQIVTAFIFASILFKVCINTKRRLYTDLFCLLMGLAIIDYILLYICYINDSVYVFDAFKPLYDTARTVLCLADIVILYGVINGCTGSGVYKGLVSYISNGLSRGYLFLQMAEENKGSARSTQTKKGSSINV